MKILRAKFMLLPLAGLAAFAAGGLIRAGEAAAPAGTAPAAAVPGPFADSTVQLDFAGGLYARELYAEAVQEYGKFIAAYPQDPRLPEAVFRRGEAAFAAGDHQTAAHDFHEYLTKLIAADPGAAGRAELARLRYGCALFELKAFDRAVSALAPLAESKGEPTAAFLPANYYLGRALQGVGQPERALVALERVNGGELAPLALFARGEALAELGRHAEAARLFAEFGQKHPTHDLAAGAGLRRGEALRRAGDPAGAAAAFGELLAKPTTAPETRDRAEYGLAWVRYTQEDYAAAGAAAEALAKKVQEPQLQNGSWYLLGLCRLQKPDAAGALEALAKVGDGEFAGAAQRQRAWALLQQNQPDRALAVAAECRARGKGEADPELDYLCGQAQARAGDWRAAVESLRRARDARGAYQAGAAYELAQAQEAAGDPAGAAESYEYFVTNFARDARQPQALLRWGQALMAKEKYEAALPVLARLLARSDTAPALREAALGQQAVCYYWLKQYANMVACYRTLLEQFPAGEGAPEALYWLAWHDQNEKRFAAAAESYARLLAEFPQQALADKARYRRAICLYQAGAEDQAAAALYEIVRDFPRISVDQQELLWLGSHLMKKNQLAEADSVYEALLARRTGKEVRAVALFYQAEVKRLRGDWDGALVKYRRLLAEKESGLENLARLGAGVCLREKGQLDEARTELTAAQFRPDDPLTMNHLYQLGLLEKAAGNPAAAAERLLKVGLLYDDEKLCGEALLLGGECLARAREQGLAEAEKNAPAGGLSPARKAELALPFLRKERLCYRELAGEDEQSFGRRHPQNPLIAEGRTRLARVEELLRAAGAAR